MKQLLCVLLIVLLLVTCLLAVGCGEKKVSEEPEPDQEALGKDLMKQLPAEGEGGGDADGGGD